MEFASICISLVISLLVSGILLGLPFLISSNSSTFFRRVRHFFISFVLLSPIMFFTFIFFDNFTTIFFQIGIALGSRALSFALLKLGLAGGLALAIGSFARVLITGEQVSEMVSPLHMIPTGSDSGNCSPGWTSILGSGSSGGNSGWTSILGQGDGSEFSVNQPTPTNSTQTGSASETGENVIPIELQQKKEELHSLVLAQFLHYGNRGLPSWQIDRSSERIELAHLCVRDIIRSLEIEDSVSEYERWQSHLRTNPSTLHPLFQDYKTKR